jgi:hypothetical protein
LNPSACAPVRFRGGAHHPTGLLSLAEDGEVESQGLLGPHPLSRRGSPPGDFISHVRKAGDLNATDMAAHRLAGEPGALAGSPSVPFPGFEPGRHPPEGCGSASWPRRAWSGYRESDPDLHHGKVMRCRCATSASSLLGESDPGYRLTMATCCHYH